MNFKDFAKNRLVLQEVSQRVRDNLPEFLQGGAPFDHIFGDKKRIVEPMKKVSEYHSKIRNSIIEDYELDFEKWAGFKITDKDKKNPIRIGKLLSQRKQAIEKHIRLAPNKTEMERTELLGFQNQLANIDNLLKVTNLQQAYLDAQKSSYYVIYSRMPIDVVRMSDHEWTSCHSEGGSGGVNYFYCALADASLNAGIAYVVTEEDLQKIDDLQKDEIFKDSDRDIEGITPQARIRIRSVYDKAGNSLAVPATRVYKANRFTMGEDFKSQVIDWAKRQDTSNIDWENTLTLRGGSYEDAGTKISEMVKTIWGKDITYRHNKDDESDWEDDENTEDEYAEEQWWDEQRDEFDPDSIYEEVFGTDDWQGYFDISYDIADGELTLQYNIPDGLQKRLTKSEKWNNRTTDNTISNVPFDGAREWEQERILHTYIDGNDLVFRIEKRFDARDYGDYYGGGDGGRFNDKRLKDDVESYFRKAIVSYTGENYFAERLGFVELRMMMNKKICDMFEVAYETIDDGDLKDLVEMFSDYKKFINLKSFTIPDLIPEIYTHNWKELVGPKEQLKEIAQIVSDTQNYIEEYISNKFGVQDYYNFIYPIVKIPEEMIPTRVYINDATRSAVPFNYEATLGRKIPKVDFNIYLEDSEIDELIDDGLVKQAYDALTYLRDDFSDEHLEGVNTLYDAERVTKSLVPPRDDRKIKDRELTRQGQMELDLSSINRDMTTRFDAFIKKIFQEGLGDMGQGGLAKRGGSGTTPTSSSSSTSAPKQVAGGVQMKHSNGPIAQKTPTSGGTSQQPMDYGAILTDPTAFELFQSDPNNIEGFRQHMADPKNFENLQKSIKDPNAWTTVAQLLASPQQ